MLERKSFSAIYSYWDLSVSYVTHEFQGCAKEGAYVVPLRTATGLQVSIIEVGGQLGRFPAAPDPIHGSMEHLLKSNPSSQRSSTNKERLAYHIVRILGDAVHLQPNEMKVCSQSAGTFIQWSIYRSDKCAVLGAAGNSEMAEIQPSVGKTHSSDWNISNHCPEPENAGVLTHPWRRGNCL